MRCPLTQVSVRPVLAEAFPNRLRSSVGRARTRRGGACTGQSHPIVQAGRLHRVTRAGRCSGPGAKQAGHSQRLLPTHRPRACALSVQPADCVSRRHAPAPADALSSGVSAQPQSARNGGALRKKQRPTFAARQSLSTEAAVNERGQALATLVDARLLLLWSSRRAALSASASASGTKMVSKQLRRPVGRSTHRSSA